MLVQLVIHNSDAECALSQHSGTPLSIQHVCMYVCVYVPNACTLYFVVLCVYTRQGKCISDNIYVYI